MKIYLFAFLLSLFTLQAVAQPEVEPWGNLTGIRVDGQLMAFESSLRLVGPDGAALFTAKEKQNPKYSRDGKTQLVNTHLDSLYFTETVEETGWGMARIKVSWTAHADMKIEGVYFGLDLPEDFSAGRTEQTSGNTGVKIITPHRQLEIRLDQPTPLIGSTGADHHTRFDIPLLTGDVQKGQSGAYSLSITAAGDIDHTPAHLTINTASPGRRFDGIGGNFRIQNPKTDPQVIAYCLENLRVAWGRVELLWRFWQPAIDGDPLDSARAGHLHPAVQKAVDMARTLSEKKIPLIVSAWFPPDWAAEGPIHFRPGPDHIRGNPLNHTNDQAIYTSITDYLIFLREKYHIEVRYFSFNETDLGINVRQTAHEHDALIKGLGAYFASRGLTTKVLLGDNSDATTWSLSTRL